MGGGVENALVVVITRRPRWQVERTIRKIVERQSIETRTTARHPRSTQLLDKYYSAPEKFEHAFLGQAQTSASGEEIARRADLELHCQTRADAMLNLPSFAVLVISAVWLFAGGDAADFCRCPAVAEVAEPVCGTDGQTYQSRAYLYCAARCQKKDIKVAHPGNC
ncbi:uncharacterized protein LOC131672423 isoform X1 [Phymastichus coffea]|uniref:uncharacterized protein LOC131672423 isoform X1 n=1 Tax=Phymastichus coffea TaxID=108790 RepID=UPI00273B9FC2|nr:uncharacterized protein LOC131672423 isoform X1 [Phymastichus coffea]